MISNDTFEPKQTCFNEEHPENKHDETDFFRDWSVISSIDEQFLNAAKPIDFTANGIFILDNDVHPSKAPSSMLISVGGILTYFNDAQFLKVFTLIEFIEFGILKRTNFI